MPLILVILILFAVRGDRNNRFTGKQFSGLKKLIGILFVISICSAVIPALIPILGISMILEPIIVPILMVWALLKFLKKNNKKADYKGSYNQRNDSSGNYYGYSEPPKGKKDSILPKAASKRRKIIEKFNKKYELYLTESQIQRIVDASYYSASWEKEIAAMAEEYASVYEWFQGDTAWLRAYLKAFRVQSISSDFEQQKQICFSEYDQVFGGVNFARAYSQEDAIAEINDRFFTGFDDISFMIAYRFLEANGRKYDLSRKEVIRNEDEADALARKYDRMPSY